MVDVVLRAVEAGDIDRFFVHQQDPAAHVMAGSTSTDPHDRAAFAAKWTRLLADPSITARTVLAGGEPAGYVASFLRDDVREVAYWLERAQWGRGIASAALARFLAELPERPLHARVVHDNVASLRVLEKCGFRRIGTGRFVSHARGGEVDEVVFRLGPDAQP